MKQAKAGLWLCLQVGFLAGLIIGWASLTMLVSARIDDYHRLLRQYVSTVAEQDTRLQKLEESLAAVRQRQNILSEIKIYLTYGGDEIDRIALEGYVSEMFSGLIGKEVKDIDVELLGVLIDDRIMTVEGRQYVYRLRYAVLTETLSLWVDVRRAAQPAWN